MQQGRNIHYHIITVAKVDKYTQTKLLTGSQPFEHHTITLKRILEKCYKHHNNNRNGIDLHRPFEHNEPEVHI